MKWTMKMEERYLWNTATILDKLKTINNMDKSNKGIKPTVQWFSEPSDPVTVSSDLSGSTRRS